MEGCFSPPSCQLAPRKVDGQGAAGSKEAKRSRTGREAVKASGHTVNPLRSSTPASWASLYGRLRARFDWLARRDLHRRLPDASPLPVSLATHHHALFDQKAWGRHEVYQTGLKGYCTAVSAGDYVNGLVWNGMDLTTVCRMVWRARCGVWRAASLSLSALSGWGGGRWTTGNAFDGGFRDNGLPCLAGMPC